jgi:two-component system LytT family response regulator
MKRINAIIIDDEAGAVHTLSGMLAEFCPMVHILSIADNIEQGIRAVRQYRPELVFLDIEMPPQGTGFDFLRQTEDCDFGVIFTTAHAHYAIQAINNVQPIAYLVKPIRVSELIQAIHTATVRAGKPAAAAVPADPAYRGIVLGDARKGSLVIRHADILYCQADGSCTVFFISRDGGAIERQSVYRTLKEVESELPADTFYRTHHSFLVNMAHIQRYERQGRTGVLYLPRDTRVEVSKHKMDEFIKTFHEFLRGGAGK